MGEKSDTLLKSSADFDHGLLVMTRKSPVRDLSRDSPSVVGCAEKSSEPGARVMGRSKTDLLK